MRTLAMARLLAAAAWAANVKLYLKDGSFHVVRECKALEDRVRFYSVERGDWKEKPLELIDLKRTQGEASSRQAALEREAKVLAEEDRVARETEREIMRTKAIQHNAGVKRVADRHAERSARARA